MQHAPTTSSFRRLVLATATLWQREMVRFVRQRNRVIGALATPLVFWLLLGSGLDNAAPIAPGVGYREYFFAGTLLLILLFTAIFSTISVIEDRREGFLQSVLVSPAPRLAIVLGKIMGGASIATLQGALFLLLWPLVGGFDSIGQVALALAVMFVLAIGLTALGLCLAWPMDSTAGFHAIMNLLLMPMWFLSGAVFPADQAPLWLRIIMWANPLTYGHAVLSAMLSPRLRPQAPLPLATAVMLVATILLVLLAAALARRPRRDGT